MEVAGFRNDVSKIYNEHYAKCIRHFLIIAPVCNRLVVLGNVQYVYMCACLSAS